MWQGPGTGPPPGWQPKQKIVAGILGILLGGLGVHSFYLGNSKKGIIQLVLSVVTCGLLGLWGFIEGIMILIGNVNTDAYGVPLTD
jgi:TM2 domain-containing membrane protein YozV